MQVADVPGAHRRFIALLGVKDHFSAELVEHGKVVSSSGREVEFLQEGPMVETSGHHHARCTRGMRVMLTKLKLLYVRR